MPKKYNLIPAHVHLAKKVLDDGHELFFDNGDGIDIHIHSMDGDNGFIANADSVDESIITIKSNGKMIGSAKIVRDYDELPDETICNYSDYGYPYLNEWEKEYNAIGDKFWDDYYAKNPIN